MNHNHVVAGCRLAVVLAWWFPASDWLLWQQCGLFYRFVGTVKWTPCYIFEIPKGGMLYWAEPTGVINTRASAIHTIVGPSP